MNQYWFINCNKCTTPMQDVNNRGSSVGGGEGVYGIFFFLISRMKISGYSAFVPPDTFSSFSTLLYAPES